MRKNGVGTLIATVVVAFGSLLATQLADFKPNLGLDLQGGVSVVLQPTLNGKKTTKVSSEALEQTQSIIETRVNGIGVGEPEITLQGSTIVVQLPGVKNQKRVLDLVGKTAELRFRPVLEAPTPAPPKDAAKQIKKLRDKLKMPEGVTAEQVFTDETSKTLTATPQATATDENGNPITLDTTGATGATGASGAEGASGTDGAATAPSNSAAPETTAAAASGAGTGGRSSAKTPARPQQDSPTTTAAAAVTSTGPSGTTGESGATGATGDSGATGSSGPTTTTIPAPLNQYGIQIRDADFATLYQLEKSVAAAKSDITKSADDKPEVPVTLKGKPDENGNSSIYKLGPSLLSGRSIEDATAALQNGQWSVNPKFKEGAKGIDLFNAAAAQCNPASAVCPAQGNGGFGALAVVLDGVVLTAPTINEPTFKRDQIVISGSFTEVEAKDTALALRYGSLPIELEPQQVQTVSATLGDGALRAGLIAGAVGLGLVVLFLIAYYRLLGLITVGSLLCSSALLASIIRAFGEWQGLTLTLAGIVGIIVSIGVSLDSSVVYFENLKEDVRAGRTLRTTVGKSFTDAYGTIAKADFSSLIGATVLYLLSVGPVKGFAFYLALSTILDLVMAYFFLRPATALLARSGLGLRPALFGIGGVAVDAATPKQARGRSKAAGAADSKPKSAASSTAVKDADSTASAEPAAPSGAVVNTVESAEEEVVATEDPEVATDEQEGDDR